MSNTVDCPHQEAAARPCPGCTIRDYQDAVSYLIRCEGEITARVNRDSEGDAGVIGGTNSFWATEDEELDCGCALTDAEWQRVR